VNIDQKLRELGVSPIVLVVSVAAIVVFFFTSMRPSLLEYKKWSHAGMICSNESFWSPPLDPYIPREHWSVVGLIFAGRVYPMESYVPERIIRPEGDPMYDSSYFIRPFGEIPYTVERDGHRFFASKESYGGGDEYSESIQIGNPVLFLNLHRHPDLIDKDIPDDARVYFDFESVVATVEWGGEVQATYNCFNSER
jgi:hypothetical protein